MGIVCVLLSCGCPLGKFGRSSCETKEAEVGEMADKVNIYLCLVPNPTIGKYLIQKNHSHVIVAASCLVVVVSISVTFILCINAYKYWT